MVVTVALVLVVEMEVLTEKVVVEDQVLLMEVYLFSKSHSRW